MRLPNGEVIMHAGRPYDPQKAHDYYERTKKLKGRKKGDTLQPAGSRPQAAQPSAKKNVQKQVLTARINELQGKLHKLEALIKKKEQAAQSEDRKAKAKKNRSAKEAAKPDTAAEKAKKAREGKKYRAKNKTKLANKPKTPSGKSGGGSKASSATNKPSSSGTSVKELKTLATKVKGQLAVAKTKLRAL